MCSGDVQSGLSPTMNEGRKHEVCITLVQMVSVPEGEGANNSTSISSGITKYQSVS